MTPDTVESAYAKARQKQRAGESWVTLALPPLRNRVAMRVDAADILTEGQDSGSWADVLQRTSPYTLVRADVIDVIAIARAHVERQTERPERPPVTKRRRSLGHLMSR